MLKKTTLNFSPPELSHNKFLVLQGTPKHHEVTKFSPRPINSKVRITPRSMMKKKEVLESNEFFLQGNSVHENT